jgi:hypothetical protein
MSNIRRIENFLINNIGPFELFILIFVIVCFYHGFIWINRIFDIYNIFITYVFALFIESLFIFGYTVVIIAICWILSLVFN